MVVLLVVVLLLVLGLVVHKQRLIQQVETPQQQLEPVLITMLMPVEIMGLFLAMVMVMVVGMGILEPMLV